MLQGRPRSAACDTAVVLPKGALPLRVLPLPLPLYLFSSTSPRATTRLVQLSRHLAIAPTDASACPPPPPMLTVDVSCALQG